MGLLTTIHNNSRVQRVTEEVNHRYETPPQVIKKMHDWQKELVDDYIREDRPILNGLAEVSIYDNPSTKATAVAFRLNGSLTIVHLNADHSRLMSSSSSEFDQILEEIFMRELWAAVK